MDLDSLSKIGEFVGGAVVVVSLLYLALQAKQSAQQQRSENYGRVVDRVTEILALVAKEPELNRLIVTGAIRLDDLSSNDRLRVSWFLNIIFNTYEFVFHQHKLKVLPQFVWGRYSKHVEFWSSMPGVRDWWRSNPGAFTEDFTVEVEARMAGEGLSIDQAIEFWRWQNESPLNKMNETHT